jgi:hypothetical protein
MEGAIFDFSWSNLALLEEHYQKCQKYLEKNRNMDEKVKYYEIGLGIDQNQLDFLVSSQDSKDNYIHAVK